MVATGFAERRPRSASAPRLCTGKHPRAVGSYGPEAIQWAESRPRLHLRRTDGLRWWQKLVLCRALEHDRAGRLVWETVVQSAPRQVGKSHLERVLCDWRIHQAARFGEPQDVLHLAHKLVAAQEVWRPAARHAFAGGDRVRWANGEQMIELDDGSRWMIQAANDGAGVAFSLSMVLVDEAWRVPRHVVEAALAPTMAESVQPQLWLVSTAGTSSSDLMLRYRELGIEQLQPDRAASVLLIEWSAPPDDVDLDDPDVARLASPHWDTRRADRVQRAREQVEEWQYRQQWLNQWVPVMSAPLFDVIAWQANEWPGSFPPGGMTIGVDVAADRSRAAIVVYCSGVADVVRDDRPGVAWVAQRVAELARKWHPTAIAADQTGPAATVLSELAAIDDVCDLLVPCNGRVMATASGLLHDEISSGRVQAMRDTPELSAAISGARKRVYGQTWTFARDESGIVLLALTAARWAADHAPMPVEASAIW